MEYVYAALMLNETGAEINEENLTNVIDAAGAEVEQSRIKALIAALEDVDIDEAVEEATAVPAAASGGAAAASPEPSGGSDDGGAEPEPEDDEPAADEGGDDDEDVDGEGLGELFG